MFQVLWPIMNGKPVNEQRVAQLEKKMIITLDLMENVWLKNKTFLCGNEISISDILGICEIDQTSEYIFVKQKYLINILINFCLGMAGFDPYANRPNLSKWKTRTVSYLSPFYEEANEILNEHAAKYNKMYGKPKSNI